MSVDSKALFPFLCVCGETLEASSTEGGVCTQCGREYSGQAVNASMTMTMGPALAVPDDETNDEMIGQSVDHFTIIDRLGSGGMGNVYRAMDESLQRYVALKLIRRAIPEANATDHVERLLQEARAQARVNHANIVHIYYVSRHKEMPYLAMELVPGETLAGRIAGGDLSYGEVLGIGLQVAQALRESAKFDIVHGDIKPSNILLNGNHAKLSDFGLAHRVSTSDSSMGKVVGTPNYMSPEACRGESPTIQSDMYSFGVMLYEMTFGRLPYSFRDSTITSRLNAHQFEIPEFPVKWPVEIPELWRSFLERLLAKNPEDRFDNWDDLIREMRSLRPLKPVAAGHITRGIAWGLDLVLLIVAQILVSTIFRFAGESLFSWVPGFNVVIISSILIVPAFVMWWVARGGASPGKKMMQLRVVDRHGLRLGPKVLARRSIIQFLPIWCLPTAHRIDDFGLPASVYGPIWIAMGVFMVIDIAMALIRPGGKSLHDQFFDTRVVLLDSREEA